MNYKKRKKQLAFTLIELLVVVAILGLMASVLLVSLNSARIKARNVRRAADIRQIVTALNLFYNDYGRYPCHELDDSNQANWLKPLVTKKYLTQVPRDPRGGDYMYEYQTFKESSSGPCGRRVILAYYAEGDIGCTMTDAKADIYDSEIDDATHCHLAIPTVLPDTCPNPYWFYGIPWPTKCEQLRDKAANNEY